MSLNKKIVRYTTLLLLILLIGLLSDIISLNIAVVLFAIFTYPIIFCVFMIKMKNLSQDIKKLYPDFYEKNKSIAKLGKIKYLNPLPLFNITEIKKYFDESFLERTKEIRSIIKLMYINLFLIIVFGVLTVLVHS